jgi:hypothetical protein
MTPEEKKERRAVELKPLADLWMHQNNIMWARVQTLLFMQAGFLGVGYTLWTHKLWYISVLSLLLLISLTVSLYLIARRDRAKREKYAKVLETLDFYIFAGQDNWGSSWYIGLAFTAAVILDISAIVLFAA